MDRLTDETHYNLNTWVDDQVVDWRKPMHDPFHTTTVHTEVAFTWRERLAVLFGRHYRIETVVQLTADPDVVNAVMRLSRDEDGTVVLPPQAPDTLGLDTVPGRILGGEEHNDTDGRFH